MIIIDARDQIVGRFATYAAKQALLGETVHVINCEEAVLSGAKKDLLKKWKHRTEKVGQPQQGPYIPRLPDRFVRRAIRGMLPHKQERGKKALGRVKCHIGTPKDLEGKGVQYKSVKELPNLKYLKIKTLCKELGGYHG